MSIRKQQRKQEAEQRMSAHNLLTLAQKIAKAAGRRGLSQKEIARLTKQLEKAAA